MLLWHHFIGLSQLETWLVVIFFDMHTPPCVQRLGSNTPCHSDAWPGFENIVPSYALLWSWTWFTPRLVSFHCGLSRAVTCHFCVVVFMRSRLHRLCCDWIGEPNCAMICFHWNGANLHWSDCWVQNRILPWSWLQELQPWVLNVSYAHAMIDWYSRHLTMWTKKGNSYWEK